MSPTPLISARLEQACRTALAITLAYGLALWFDWAKPMWAAFAVALISMPTLAASLAKGGQRLWGTLLAFFVALTLIALFPQHRWSFMLAQAAWLAFCTYQMTGGKQAYLWFCAGFVTSIITANGGPDPAGAFTVAVTRALETALGIGCFALVFGLLWPSRQEQEPAPKAAAATVPTIDQRMNMAAQVFIAYCAAFVLVIYVPAFPGSYGFLGMLAPFAIILATSPQISPPSLALPVTLSILFATPIYMFLMPMLDGFAQLAAVIFIACFSIAWVLHTPQQGLARTFGLAFFAVVTSIANEQSYSFLALANTVLMFALVLLVLYLCTSIRVFAPVAGPELAQATENT